jgi:hypothetical protein
MTVTDRIQQLERRLVFLNEYGSQSFKKMFNVADTQRNIEGQIQALRWMLPKPLVFKRPKGMGDEDIIDRFKNCGEIFYKKPTEGDYDGGKVDFMLDDELSHLPKSDDIEKRWWQVKTYLGLASDKDEVVDYKNTTGLED